MYTDADVALVRRMDQLARGGMALSRAAKLSLDEFAGGSIAAQADVPYAPLLAALLEFDEERALAAWQAVAKGRDIVALLDRIVSPLMIAVGEGWHRGEVSVAQEHFASEFVRSRLEAIGQQVCPSPASKAVVVACLPGEDHDLAPLMLATVLRLTGLRSIFLGRNVPIDDLAYAVEDTGAGIVALHATTGEAGALLTDCAKRLNNTRTRPAIVYGGQYFDENAAQQNENEEQHGPRSVFYGGNSLGTAIHIIQQLAERIRPRGMS
ncbi:hypothetical protein AYO38_06625 [bacterium SCGC AG-212-C10]|nr:hypothetical protein AYO38_06625 [bacterium SCGC AG-212-C10]